MGDDTIDLMKIKLAINDTKGRSVAFVSDTTQLLSIQDAIRLIRSWLLDNVYVVRGSSGEYVRSAANASSTDTIDYLSVSGPGITSYANRIKRISNTQSLDAYLKQYVDSLKGDGPFLTPVGYFKTLVADVKSHLTPQVPIIIAASEEFSIDTYLLGAILVDEIARMLPFEQIVDFVGAEIVGRDMLSIGIAQVKIETANALIKKGVYNPKPSDKNLPFAGTLSNEDRRYLYKYLIQPKHNIRFAAARIRDLIDEWASIVDISEKPEILATLYSHPYKKPHSNPKSDERGKQIAIEFYRLSKKWIDSM